MTNMTMGPTINSDIYHLTQIGKKSRQIADMLCISINHVQSVKSKIKSGAIKLPECEMGRRNLGIAALELAREMKDKGYPNYTIADELETSVDHVEEILIGTNT